MFAISSAESVQPDKIHFAKFIPNKDVLNEVYTKNSNNRLHNSVTQELSTKFLYDSTHLSYGKTVL